MKQKPIYLYILSQSLNVGPHTYDGAVVAAESEEVAKTIRPDNADIPMLIRMGVKREEHGWAPPELVTAKKIGKAVAGTKPGLVMCSLWG